MSELELASASKFMSLVLRHQPEAIGLVLDSEGWASIAELVEKSNGRLTEALVRQIVAESDKKRFAISEEGSEIRANQGHSIAVDLKLEPREPPVRLFHGTSIRFLAAIRVEGILPRSRQYVHLSKDQDTAASVGARHGKPTVLAIDSARLHSDGHPFFLSQNGIWLTKHVPAAYIEFGAHPAA